MQQTQPKPSLESVTVTTTVDEWPDLSHLGKYQDSPGPDDRTIDRKERGDMRRDEYRYFVAMHSGDQTGNPDSVIEDYERYEAFNRGDWTMIGVRAKAGVAVNGTVQTIQTGGLWGIGSDSGRNYFNQVALEELYELRNALVELGIDVPDPMIAKWDDNAHISGEVRLD